MKYRKSMLKRHAINLSSPELVQVRESFLILRGRTISFDNINHPRGPRMNNARNLPRFALTKLLHSRGKLMNIR
jgi:hypothetical protein